MSNSKDCACSQAPAFIFACSGAADVGEVADQAARRLSASGQAKMFCLAGIGGRVSGILKSTEAASKILVIDGCSLDCARHTLEEAGFREFAHVSLGTIGMPKGATPPTEENIARAVGEARQKLDSWPGGSCREA